MLNNISLMGRMVKDPELKTTSGKGTYYTRFCIAVKRDIGEDKTDFIDCVAWTRTAEMICKHFKKGHRIIITGILTTSMTGEGDAKRKYCEVLVQNVEFVEPKEEQKAPAQTEVVPVPPTPFDVPATEEEQKALPFDVLGF